MRRIAIDCRFAATASGLGRYTRELTMQLLEREDPIHYVLLVSDDSEDWILPLPHPDCFSKKIVTAPHYSISEQFELPKVLRDAKVDLLFSPHFNVPWRCPVPFVMTVHDLILHRYPNAAPFWKRFAYRLILESALHHASHIITVSDFVRGEIESVYGEMIASRATVIHEGVSSHFSRRSEAEQESVRKKYNIDRLFFLYVGNAKEHKNVSFLLQAWQESRDESSQLVLVTSGKEADELALPPNVLRLAHVDDADLPALYSASRAFVTASLYEGYCLPLVEALSCGCPAIALREGPLEEVSQGKALLVEPTIEAFTKALRSPPPSPQSFTRPSWEETAKRTVEIFDRALTSKP